MMVVSLSLSQSDTTPLLARVRADSDGEGKEAVVESTLKSIP